MFKKSYTAEVINGDSIIIGSRVVQGRFLSPVKAIKMMYRTLMSTEHTVINFRRV